MMEFGEEYNGNTSNVRTSFMPQRNKTVWLFHFLFRTLAVATYLFGGLFFTTFISRFIAILALVSADFWWVKNVSGRILVGMRWWNIVDDAGGSQWHFESRAEDSTTAATVETALQKSFESNLFWLSLVGFQIVWLLFLLLNLFTFRLNWFVVTLIANVMSGSNLYGYLRCRFGREGLLSGSTMLSLMGPQMLRSALSSVVSAVRPGANNAAGNSSGFAAAQPSFATQTMSM